MTLTLTTEEKLATILDAWYELKTKLPYFTGATEKGELACNFAFHHMNLMQQDHPWIVTDPAELKAFAELDEFPAETLIHYLRAKYRLRVEDGEGNF